MSEKILERRERLPLPVDNLRFETREDGEEVLTGTAIPFGVRSENLGGFVEQVDPAFVDRTITSLGEGERMLALWNHSSSDTIGNTGPKGGLTVSKEKHGLDFELPAANLTGTQRRAIEREDVSRMSFGFFVTKDEWERGEDDKPDVRTLLDGTILEISPVTWPAYKTTSVTLAQRSHETWRAGLEADLKVEAEALEAAFELLEDETPVVDTKDRDRKVKLMEMET